MLPKWRLLTDYGSEVEQEESQGKTCKSRFVDTAGWAKLLHCRWMGFRVQEHPPDNQDQRNDEHSGHPDEICVTQQLVILFMMRQPLHDISALLIN